MGLDHRELGDRKIAYYHAKTTARRKLIGLKCSKWMEFHTSIKERGGIDKKLEPRPHSAGFEEEKKSKG